MDDVASIDAGAAPAAMELDTLAIPELDRSQAADILDLTQSVDPAMAPLGRNDTSARGQGGRGWNHQLGDSNGL